MAKGKAQKKHNEAEKLELVTAICELYGTGLYTIESCCENKGIVWATFYIWITENDILNELYKSAKIKSVNSKKKNLRELVQSEIVKRVQGYTDTEETVEGKNVDGTFVATKVIRKKVKTKASDTLLIFLSKNTNIDGEIEFSDSQKMEHSGDVQMNITGIEIHK